MEHLKDQNETLKTKGLQCYQAKNQKRFSLALGSFADISSSSPGFAAKKTVRPAAF
jgi:hypothetical protein